MSADNMLSSLSLFRATPDQIRISRQRTHPQWGRGLTEEQYLTRDLQLDKLEHAADGKLATWVLAPREIPTTLEFKCACETYQRKVLVKRPGSLLPEFGVGYAIASVFTPPENRRKGYAQHMMRLLHWVIAPHNLLPAFPQAWGNPPPKIEGFNNATFSVLYSDVGDFYLHAGPDGTSNGWVIRDPISTVWTVPEQPLESVEENIKWLDENELLDLWKLDAEMIYTDLKNSDSDKVLFSYLPDNGVANSLVRRTLYFLPGLSYKRPTKWGAILPSGEIGEAVPISTFATWTLDIRPPPSTLIITRLRTTPSAFPKLLTAILSAAKENDMEEVEIWNLPKDLAEIAHKLEGITETRTEHLNAFKWYGPEKNEEVEWIFNEKFCWC